MEPDEDLYEIAMKEVATSPRTGLLAKCITLCDGDESKAKIKYIKIRVKEMKAQIAEGIKKEKEAAKEAEAAARYNPSVDGIPQDHGEARFPWGVTIITVAMILLLMALAGQVD